MQRVIIIIGSMISVFNTDSSLPYIHDRCDMGLLLVSSVTRTIRVFSQSFWLKSPTASQRSLVENANALPFLRNRSPHVPTPNPEGQETVFVRPLTIDQLGMRDSVSVSIAQWVAEVCKPSHHGKVQYLRDGCRVYTTSSKDITLHKCARLAHLEEFFDTRILK
ncbi:hypothetical protein CSKR_111060 [Clonorchis sinensis]|uniref:Uncharacterized protein n=1 Tax=Clonorchis sinensis TaxID=79923 RepID=A0A3R7F5G4_CLOSI|nr:hypothetical protein CSKR_111060 [Clonorchis sinensis]